MESIKRLKSEEWRVKNLHIQLWRNLFNIDFDTSPLSTLQSPLFKKAFTLAEVLITLAVIGVVAALTMPTLINKHQVASWEAGLKKSYSTITNGFHAIAAENGGDLRNSGLFDDIDDDTFSERMDKAVKEHFKVVKTCKIGDTENCPGYTYKYLNGNLKLTLFSAEHRFVAYLSDGIILSLFNTKDCPATNYQNESNFKHNCNTIHIDINGEKKPNQLGKDMFQFSIDEKGNLYAPASLEWSKAMAGQENALTYEVYWRNAHDQCGEPGKKTREETIAISGADCPARIMEMGWQMDYLK